MCHSGRAIGHISLDYLHSGGALVELSWMVVLSFVLGELSMYQIGPEKMAKKNAHHLKESSWNQLTWIAKSKMAVLARMMAGECKRKIG